MSLSTVEIACFKVSNDYHTDPSVLDDKFALISNINGSQGLYHGFQVEEPDTVVWINVWDSVQSTKSGVFPFVDSSPPPVRARPELIRIQFRDNVSRLLAAPITEMAVFTMKNGHKLDELIPMLDTLNKQFSVAKDCYSSSWGKSQGNENTVIMLVGWETVEAHWGVTRVPGALQTTISTIKNIADIKPRHVQLHTYSA